MHELSLCQSAVEIIQQQAEQHSVKRVTGVWLEIGALSCVEESAVRFSFDIVCRGRSRRIVSCISSINRLRRGVGIAARWLKFLNMIRSVRAVRAIVCGLKPAIR